MGNNFECCCQPQSKSRVLKQQSKREKVVKSLTAKSLRLRKQTTTDTLNENEEIQLNSVLQCFIKIDQLLRSTKYEWGLPLLDKFQQTIEKSRAQKWLVELELIENMTYNQVIRECFSNSTNISQKSSEVHTTIASPLFTFTNQDFVTSDTVHQQQQLQEFQELDDILDSQSFNLSVISNEAPAQPTLIQPKTFVATDNISSELQTDLKSMKREIIIKQGYLLFQSKLELMQRHLKQDRHPLRILKQQFSSQLSTYFEQSYASRQSIDLNEAIEIRRNNCIGSVQEFIVIFKEALFRFYKIQTLMRSQDDTLTAFITNKVLDIKVSAVLISASKDSLHRQPDYTNLKLAVSAFKQKPLTFWYNQASQNQSYDGTIELLKLLKKCPNLGKFKRILQDVWHKMQEESDFMLSEDNRLMIACYCIVQAQCYKLCPIITATLDFINDQIYEESAPFATFESAIQVICYEFENQQFSAIRSKEDSYLGEQDARQTIMTKLRRDIYKLKQIDSDNKIASGVILSSEQATRATFQVSNRAFNTSGIKDSFLLSATQDRKTLLVQNTNDF